MRRARRRGPYFTPICAVGIRMPGSGEFEDFDTEN
jgi:hypothetical protein